MNITTTRFGNLSIPDDSIITFPEGILGFPQVKQYVVLDHDSENTPFKWLQAVGEPNLAFVIIDPLILLSTYKIPVDEQIEKELGNDMAPEDILLMAIVKIPHSEPIKTTVNLRAPIVVIYSKRIAYQIVLMDEEYSLNHPVFSQEQQPEEIKKLCA